MKGERSFAKGPSKTNTPSSNERSSSSSADPPDPLSPTHFQRSSTRGSTGRMRRMHKSDSFPTLQARHSTAAPCDSPPTRMTVREEPLWAASPVPIARHQPPTPGLTASSVSCDMTKRDQERALARGVQTPSMSDTTLYNMAQTTTTAPSTATTPEMPPPLAYNLRRPKVEQAGPQKTQWTNTTSVPAEENPGLSRPTEGYRRSMPPTRLRPGGSGTLMRLQISSQLLGQHTPASLHAPPTLSEARGYTRPDGQPAATDTQTGDSLQPAVSPRLTLWSCSTLATNTYTRLHWSWRWPLSLHWPQQRSASPIRAGRRGTTAQH